MLTAIQIQAGEDRLVNDKLTPVDVDSTVSILRMFCADLEVRYGYKFREKLEALDDSENGYQKAAQVAACLIIMEGLGFGVAALDGELKYKEKDDYAQYVTLIFSKLYPIPVEWSIYDLRRRRVRNYASNSTLSKRKENW